MLPNNFDGRLKKIVNHRNDDKNITIVEPIDSNLELFFSISFAIIFLQNHFNVPEKFNLTKFNAEKLLLNI